MLSKNMNKNKGGKKLSEGSYGCVVTPAYNCPGKKINPNKHVSKLLKRNPPDNSEIQFGKLLKKIDPHNKHFIFVNNSCSINSQNISSSDLKDCGLDHPSNIHNYILRKGGNDLGDVKVNVKTAHKFTIQILQSIKKLVAHNIINMDIKRPNIITDPPQQNAFMIDFGSDFVFQSYSKFFSNFFINFDFNAIRDRWGTYIWAPEIFRRLPNYNSIPSHSIKLYGHDDKEFGVRKSQVMILNKYNNDLTPKKWKIFAEKVMMYSLGLALEKFYTDNVIKPSNKSDKKLLNKLKNISFGMRIINPYLRYNIKEILHILKPKTPSPIIIQQSLKTKVPNKSSPITVKQSKKNNNRKNKSKKSKIGESCKTSIDCARKKPCINKKCTSTAKKSKKTSKKSTKKSMDKKLCKQFLKNTTINPISKRKIKHNGPTYKKLIKQCK